MLYEEESKGSIAREDIYKVDRVVSRDLSRARRGVPLPTFSL